MIDQTDYTARLAHYNTWLLDENREFGVPYPGYPGDKARATAKANLEVRAAKVARATKVARAKRSGPTKLEQAKELFKLNSGLCRENMIALFMDRLQMSKAGATTYYYNAQK